MILLLNNTPLKKELSNEVIVKGNIFSKIFFDLFFLTILYVIISSYYKDRPVDYFLIIFGFGLFLASILIHTTRIIINEKGICRYSIYTKHLKPLCTWDNIVILESQIVTGTVRVICMKKFGIRLGRIVFTNVNPALKLIYHYGKEHFSEEELAMIKFHMNKHIWNFTWLSSHHDIEKS